MREIRGWTPLPVPGSPKVSMVIATYDQRDELACLLYSFKAQTYANWEAIVVHDGPGPLAHEVVTMIGDERIRLIETSERRGQFGHPWRQSGIDVASGDFIGLSNGDNYYVPVYFEWMLNLLTTQNADIVYCDWLHSYVQWQPIQAQPKKHFIDLGCWLARAGLVKTTPWQDNRFDGDGTYFEDLLRKSTTVLHLPRPLFVHN